MFRLLVENAADGLFGTQSEFGGEAESVRGDASPLSSDIHLIQNHHNKRGAGGDGGWGGGASEHNKTV